VIVGVGIDLVDIARVERMVSRWEARAIARLFTEGEAAYARARAEPARHFASRFAAKEAAFKALAGDAEARAIAWREIEVVVEADGRPSLRLHGTAARRAAALRVRRAMLSLTHCHGVAGAVVVLEGDG
jgi:holo-[acyl-carrier protein] synthase